MLLTNRQVQLLLTALEETALDEERTRPSVDSEFRKLLVEIQESIDGGTGLVVPARSARPAKQSNGMSLEGAKKTVIDAIDAIEEVRKRCKPHGVTIKVGQYNSSKGGKNSGRPTAHIMFNSANGRRLVDYWPGTGNAKTDRERFSAGNLDEAATIALKQIGF